MVFSWISGGGAGVEDPPGAEGPSGSPATSTGDIT